MLAAGSSDVASTQAIRDHFPALERRHEGQSVAYFDGPGGTQVPRGVVEAMADYLYHHNANTHWAFPSSLETDEMIARARRAVADFLNAETGEVAFGNNMTSLTFHLARSLGRRMGPGDEVVVTELDHHANIDPWRAMASERGVTVRVAKMIPEDRPARLGRPPGTGQRTDQESSRLARHRTPWGRSTMSRRPRGWRTTSGPSASWTRSTTPLIRLVDVRALGCDFLACSAYKFYGPHAGHPLRTRRTCSGRSTCPSSNPAPTTAPERLETGTQNHEGIAGTAAAIDFLASLAEGPDRRSRLVLGLRGPPPAGLDPGRPALVGPGIDRRDRPLSAPSRISPERRPSRSQSRRSSPERGLPTAWPDKWIFASHGDFYATTAVRRLGRSTTRAGPRGMRLLLDDRGGRSVSSTRSEVWPESRMMRAKFPVYLIFRKSIEVCPAKFDALLNRNDDLTS